MNCKPGDLAVIVHSEIGNEGKILTCISLHPPGYSNSGPWLGPMWETDRSDITCGNMVGDIEPHNSVVPDAYLRPIRGGEGNEKWFKAAPIEHTTPKKVAA